LDLFIVFLGLFFLFFFLVFKLLLSSRDSIKTKDLLGAILVTVSFVVTYVISEVVLSAVIGGLGSINSRLTFSVSMPVALVSTWVSLIVSFYYWEGIQKKSLLINIVFLSSISAFIVADILSNIVQFLL